MYCDGIEIPAPYRGLVPYSQTNSLFFFGREKEQQIIIQNLRASRLTVLYGDSGVGKSSLLRAGVSYHLRQSAQDNLENTGKPGCAVIVFPPLKGELKNRLSWEDPIKGIEEQLESEITKLFNMKSPIDIKDIFDKTIKSISKNQVKPSLTNILKAWIEIIRSEDESGRLFIILDQFEEYFDLYNPEYDTFTDEFSQTVNNSNLNVHFLISIREDALAKLDYFKGRIFRNLLDNRLAIKHLNRQSAEDAIQSPIAEYNRQKIILDNLCNSKLTLIYGQSIAGKSTILRDGIAYYLRQTAEKNIKTSGQPKLAVTLFNSWRKGNQLDNLLLQIKTDIQHLVNIQFPHFDLSFTETLQALIKLIDTDGHGKLFIILDQFEEYLSRYPQVDDTDQFLVEIFRLLNHPNLDIHFLICIHETKFDKLKSIIQTDISNYCKQYLHLYSDKVELEPIDNLINTAIVQPDEEKLVTIEPDLMTAVLNDIAPEISPSEVRIETPYLQLVMLHLWNREMREASPSYKLQKQTYTTKLGGAKQIVQDHLAQKLEELKTDVKIEDSYRLFNYLVTPSGDKLALTAKDLCDYVNAETNQTEKLDIETVEKKWLNKLSEGEARILRPLAKRYEVFLDVLVKAISTQLQNQRKIKEIEQIAKDAWSQFDVSEFEALKKVTKAGENFLKIKNELLPKDCHVPQLQTTLQMILDNIREQNQFQAHDKQIWSVSFSPDGKYLVTGSEDGTARLWDLQGKLLQEFKDDSGCNWFWNVSFSPDGKYLASGSQDDHTVRLWDLDGNLINKFRGHNDWVWSVSFSPDGKYLASGDSDGTVCLWDLEGNQIYEPFKAQEGWAWSLSFSPDSKYLAIALSKDTVYLWNLQENSQYSFPVNGGFLYSVCFSPDGQHLATASSDGIARLWDFQGNLVKQFTGHQGWVYSVSFSPDGQYLATASPDATARLWDLDGNQLTEFKGHKGWVWGVSFSPNGQHLATVSTNCTVHIWDISSKKLAKPKDYKGWFWSVSFSSDGKYLATGSSDSIARVWNLEENPFQELSLWDLNSDPVQTFKGLINPAVIVSFSPDNQKLAASSEDFTVCLWDLQKESELPVKCKGHTQWVWSISFSHDGQRLATASSDGTARLWDLQGKPIQKFVHPDRYMFWSVCFSPDGKYLATGSDSIAYLWDLEGKLIQRFDDKDKGWIWSITFSPDGQRLATASSEGTARLWDLEGNLVQEFKGHKGWIWSISFSPDGNYLATGSSDNTARLWDLDGNLVQEFKGFEGAVYCVSFSPDGKHLATASADGTVKLWPIETVESLLEQIGLTQ